MNPFEKVSKELNIRLQTDDTKLCFEHKKYEEGVTMNLNPFTGSYECPICFRDKLNAELTKEFTEVAKVQKEDERYNTFYKKSVVPDKTILKAEFKNYLVDEPDARRVADAMYGHANDILNGQVFNVVMNGTPGVGKSHLSYSLLRHVNENCGKSKECLFVDIAEMTLKIRDSFSNKESMYTESYFNKLLGQVDVLVIDDLGSEVGKIDTDTRASDFITRILRNITTQRQDKVTIITTNLSSVTLEQIYDAKTVSRMFKKIKPLVFTGIKDKRKVDLGF